MNGDLDTYVLPQLPRQEYQLLWLLILLFDYLVEYAGHVMCEAINWFYAWQWGGNPLVQNLRTFLHKYRFFVSFVATRPLHS